MVCRGYRVLLSDQLYCPLADSRMAVKDRFAELKAYFFEDGGVIFDRSSGYTYRLDSLTLSVFAAVERLASDLETGNEQQLAERVATMRSDYSIDDIMQALAQLKRVSILSD